MANKLKYVEPESYFPEEVLKEFGLGKYAKDPDEKKEKETRELNEKFRDYVNKRD